MITITQTKSGRDVFQSTRERDSIRVGFGSVSLSFSSKSANESGSESSENSCVSSGNDCVRVV